MIIKTKKNRLKYKPGTKAAKQAGFTLVEVMVTLVIIGLMATLVVVTVLPMMSKAKSQKASVDIARLGQAIEYYYLDSNKYPESLEDLLPGGYNDGNNVNDQRRASGYIKSLPLDPWDNPYNYQLPGEHGVYDLWSWGADGKEGGEGENADITNWQARQ